MASDLGFFVCDPRAAGSCVVCLRSFSLPVFWCSRHTSEKRLGSMFWVSGGAVQKLALQFGCVAGAGSAFLSQDRALAARLCRTPLMGPRAFSRAGAVGALRTSVLPVVAANARGAVLDWNCPRIMAASCGARALPRRGVVGSAYAAPAVSSGVAGVEATAWVPVAGRQCGVHVPISGTGNVRPAVWLPVPAAQASVSVCGDRELLPAAVVPDAVFPNNNSVEAARSVSGDGGGNASAAGAEGLGESAERTDTVDDVRCEEAGFSAGRGSGSVYHSGTWKLLLKNLDRHCKGVMSGSRWHDVWEALRSDRQVDGVVLCEVCLPRGGSPPHVGRDWEVYVASRSGDYAGVMSAFRVRRRPHLLAQIVNEAMECNVNVIYEGNWAQIVFGGYIADGLTMKQLEMRVGEPIRAVLEQIKSGELRNSARPRDSLACAPIIFAADFNARFGPTDACVGGNFDTGLAGDQPLGGVPWVSCDLVLNHRGRFWRSFFREFEMRMTNDLQVTNGVRCAVATNHHESGPSVIDGVAVEVSDTGMWRHIVSVHVGEPAVRHNASAAEQFFAAQLSAVKFHELFSITFRRRVAPARAVRAPDDGAFRLRAEHVTDSQWRDFGDLADAHFMSRPPEERVVSNGLWGSIVGSMQAATSALAVDPPQRVAVPPSDAERTELRDLQAVQRAMRARAFDRGRREYHECYARWLQIKRSQQARSDARGRLREALVLKRAARDRVKHTRQYSRVLKRTLNDDKFPSMAPTELLNELGLLTSDPDEHHRLWSAQFGKVGKLPPRLCADFTPYAWDKYTPIAAAARAAKGTVEGPERQRRPFTMDQLIHVCLRLKLGKAPCRSNFYNDFWHKVAVRLIGDSADKEWRDGRSIMHAMLTAVNATYAGEILMPDHWALQAIAPVLKPLMTGVMPGDYRDVTLTSNEEKLYARMVEMRLREFAEEMGILDSCQHGFREGLSCDTALWSLMSVIEKEALLCKRKLFLVFWDVQKAFPTCWRDRLIARLVEYGVTGRLLDAVIASGALTYVRYVRVKGASGDHIHIADERGLSTGHVLSPLLYLLESNDMPEFLRDCDFDGVGVTVGGKKFVSQHFADDGVGIARTAEGMHHLLRRLEGYMDDARRKFNVENKSTVIMCFNVSCKEKAGLNFMLSGKRVDFVDAFKYLGTVISNNMSYRGTKTGHPPTLSQTTNDAIEQRVCALLQPFRTALRTREVGVRALRQLITEVCSAAEYGAGIMVRTVWPWLEKRLKGLVAAALRVPKRTRGVPSEILLGELGLMPFDLRSRMHTLRVWDAIMRRPADAIPRLAWNELVAESELRGSPKYTLVARVKDTLALVGGENLFAVGLPRDVQTETGYRRGWSPKELIQELASVQWRGACAEKRSLRSYEDVRSHALRYEAYLEHPDWQVNLARWRLRTGVCCVFEREGRRLGIAPADRTCQCAGCDRPDEVESVRHFLLVCSRWNVERQQLVSSVLQSHRISVELKARLGQSVADNPGMWLRLILGGGLHELGSEYSEPLAVLTKRISSRLWRYDVSEEDVARARRALSDRTSLVWITGRQLKSWYSQRALLSGYDHV